MKADQLRNEADLMAVAPQRVPDRTLEALRLGADIIDALVKELAEVKDALREINVIATEPASTRFDIRFDDTAARFAHQLRRIAALSSQPTGEEKDCPKCGWYIRDTAIAVCPGCSSPLPEGFYAQCQARATTPSPALSQAPDGARKAAEEMSPAVRNAYLRFHFTAWALDKEKAGDWFDERDDLGLAEGELAWKAYQAGVERGLTDPAIIHRATSPAALTSEELDAVEAARRFLGQHPFPFSDERSLCNLLAIIDRTYGLTAGKEEEQP